MEHTIPAALASAAREFGDAPALAEPGGPRLSWRQLHARATALSRVLYADGLVPGDRVAIWSPNTHHWVLGALGAFCAGATLVPVNTRFTGPEALDVISRSGACVLIVAGPFLGTDRLAALRAAAAEEDSRSRGGGCLARLRRIIQVPVEAGQAVAEGATGWAEFEDRAAAVPAGVASRPASTPRRCARTTSATSCSPRAPPGGARAC